MFRGSEEVMRDGVNRRRWTEPQSERDNEGIRNEQISTN